MNSVLNNTFWFYLFSLLDFENRLKVKNNEFAEIIKEIDEKDYLDYDFLDSYSNYPKYPNDFRPIVNLNKYNILEIYNAYSSSNDFLLASINNENILNYKNTLDTIPITKISNDVRVQTIFFQDMYNGILETDQIVNPFFSTSRDSYIFKQFGYQLPSSESNFSFIAAYALYQFLFTNMKSILDMYNKVQVYALPYMDAVNYTYQESLDKYIDSNLDTLTKQISEFVLNYVYKITLPTGEFFNNVQEIVKKNIDGKLRTSIKNYLRNQDTMVLSNVKAISQGVYSKLSEILIQDLINYTEGSSISEVINEELNNHLIKVEIEKFNKRLSNYTENNFKPYSYLIFMYNRTPLKFLNVLQLVLKFYTEHEIKLIDDYDFTEIELRSYFNTLFKKSSNSINYDNIVPLLSQSITTDLISSILIDDYTLSYMFRANMAYYIDTFFESANYDEVINSILDDVFKYLKNDLQISYKYDCYENRLLIELFLRSLLRRDILNGKMFVDRENELFELFDIYLNNFTIRELNVDQMLQRTNQYVSSNLEKINAFFENILFTALIKTMYDNHIAYYLNTNI